MKASRAQRTEEVPEQAPPPPRVLHPDYGPGADLGPAPKSYKPTHRVVRFDRSGLILRVLAESLTKEK
jgi:hypothetical protein